MNRLEHKTTEEHYNKYRDMAIKLNINLRNNKHIYIMFSVEHLKELYINDSYLNNISLDIFDSYYYFYFNPDERKQIGSLSHNVCLLKHLLIYEVLEATPIFVEVGKNYKDCPPLKK